MDPDDHCGFDGVSGVGVDVWGCGEQETCYSNASDIEGLEKPKNVVTTVVNEASDIRYQVLIFEEPTIRFEIRLALLATIPFTTPLHAKLRSISSQPLKQ